MIMTIKRNLAFTLLELVVTFVIVLVISLVAYPAFNQYFTQSKVTDAITSTAEIQTMITNQIANSGSVTGSGVNLTTPATISRFVESYSVSDNGVITVNTTANAGAVTFTLTPEFNSDAEQVSWVCAVSNSNFNSFVPNKCRI